MTARIVLAIAAATVLAMFWWQKKSVPKAIAGTPVLELNLPVWDPNLLPWLGRPLAEIHDRDAFALNFPEGLVLADQSARLALPDIRTAYIFVQAGRIESISLNHPTRPLQAADLTATANYYAHLLGAKAPLAVPTNEESWTTSFRWNTLDLLLEIRRDRGASATTFYATVLIKNPTLTNKLYETSLAARKALGDRGNRYLVPILDYPEAFRL